MRLLRNIGRVRFSLLTLVLLTLWVATAMLVWQRREPWVKTHELKHSADVTSLQFFPDNRRLLVCTRDYGCVWDVESGRELGRLTGAEIRRATISPDSARIVTWGAAWRSDANEAYLWNSASCRLLRTLKFAGIANDGAFSPDGKSFLLASRGGEVRRWTVDAVEPPEVYYSLVRNKTHISYAPDGKSFLAYGDEANTVFVFSVESGRARLELDGRTQPHSISSARFSSDGARIVTSTAWRVYLWRASDGHLLKTIKSPEFEPPVLAPNSNWFIARDMGDTSTLYSLMNGDMIVPLEGCRGNPKFVGVDSTSRRVVTIDSHVDLWDAHTGKLLYSLEGKVAVRTTGAQSFDGNNLASSSDNDVWLWRNRHPGVVVGAFLSGGGVGVYGIDDCVGGATGARGIEAAAKSA